jgi:hypothetical protein
MPIFAKSMPVAHTTTTVKCILDMRKSGRRIDTFGFIDGQTLREAEMFGLNIAWLLEQQQGERKRNAYQQKTVYHPLIPVVLERHVYSQNCRGDQPNCHQ